MCTLLPALCSCHPSTQLQFGAWWEWGAWDNRGGIYDGTGSAVLSHPCSSVPAAGSHAHQP
eukprot:scaffold23290_cov18-Tisochrysis_lutea.AAC.1